MIWDLIEETTFDKYFSDPNTTITTLLLDQNIITELKNQNPKLLEYLDNHRHQFITELIHYVIIMPNENDSHDRCHKLPYISSELLAIDSDLIYREFFEEGKPENQNEYWIKLLSFLNSPAAQNEVLIGYFQKVINNLYSGNKIKTTKIVAENLEKFTQLLPNGSVQDIIKKSLILLNTPEGAVLSQRKQILHKVIQVFVKGNENIKFSCSQVLCEVISKFQAFSSGDALLQQLLASEKLLTIYSCQNSASVNQFLQSLIKKSQQRIVNQHDQKVPILNLPSNHKQRVKGYLEREALNIRAISKSTGFIVNQNRQTVRKSNKSLYSLLRLMTIVIEDGVCTFIEQGLLSILWNLVLLYPYNNILQVLILKIFLCALKSSQESLINAFLKGYQQHLLDLSKQHLTLLKHFIFTVWKQAKHFPTQTTDPNILCQFKELVSTQLEPLLKYEILNVQKSHKPQSKLIVDEEDKKAAPKVSQENKEKPAQVLHETQKQEKNLQKKLDFFQQFEAVQLSNSYQQSESEQSSQKAQAKEDLDFFNDWNLQKLQNSVQLPSEKPNKDTFGDFSSFF